MTKLGRPDLLDACKTPPGSGQDEVKLFLTERFKEHDQSYWVEFFEGVNAAFAPVKNLREAADDIQIRHRKMIVEDTIGNEHIGIPMKFKNEPGEIKFEFAKLGQHTEEVLANVGYTLSELDQMKKSGVF